MATDNGGGIVQSQRLNIISNGFGRKDQSEQVIQKIKNYSWNLWSRAHDNPNRNLSPVRRGQLLAHGLLLAGQGRAIHRRMAPLGNGLGDVVRILAVLERDECLVLVEGEEVSKRKRATKALIPLVRTAAAQQRSEREWTDKLVAFRLQFGART